MNRTAAILCPGPSLRRAVHWSGYATLIGVNRAPLIVHPAGVRVDTWCFGNEEVFHATAPGLSYAPRAFLAGVIRPCLGDLAGFRPLLWEALHGRVPLSLEWTAYSMTAAIVLAHCEGAAHVDVYGCDRTDGPDADGVNVSRNRNDARWLHEAAVFGNLAAHLAERGTGVRRVPCPA